MEKGGSNVKETRADIEPGMKFGKLTAIEPAGKNKKGESLWIFECECGRRKAMRKYRVVSSGVRSCGCTRARFHKKHGMSDTRLYKCWKGMIGRCRPTSEKHHYYFDRGISVCEEWKNPEVFCEWAISNGYGDNLTLDRINNDGNYEPSNCRWVTQKQQVRNRSVSISVEFNGEIRGLQEWSEVLGIKIGTLYARWKKGERGEYLFREVEGAK